MGNDISNNTLALLVGVAILVSLFGLFVGKGQITGMATEDNETGNVTVEIPSSVDIVLDDDVVYFGAMIPLQTNESNSTEPKPDNISIRVAGTTNVDIAYWANDTLFNYANFSTLSVQNDGRQRNETFKIRVMGENCTGAIQGSYASYLIAETGVDNATTIVQNCQQSQSVVVGFSIQVPKYETSGTKYSQVYFRGSEYTG